MTDAADNRKATSEAAILHWRMQGRPGRKANLEFTLKVHFVELQDGRRGLVLDPAGSQVPEALTVSCFQPWDIATNNIGQVVWLAGMNGLMVEFEGDDYHLFQICEGSVTPHVGGDLYFIYPPLPAESGNLVYSEEQFLESMAAS